MQAGEPEVMETSDSGSEDADSTASDTDDEDDVSEYDLDEKDDRRIYQPLAGMLEIDRDPVADGRLHLSQPPGRKVGMANIHAGNQPAHGRHCQADGAAGGQLLTR